MKNICEEEVFNELFRQWSEKLYVFLYARFGPSNHPEDRVQEAFMVLWKNCQEVPYEKAKSYLYSVGRNMVLKGLERQKSEDRFRQQLDGEAMSASPQEILEGDEFKQRLNDALASMPEKQREAFLLSKVEGKKHREIAELLDISQKAVEKRIYAAAAFLLEKTGKKI